MWYIKYIRWEIWAWWKGLRLHWWTDSPRNDYQLYILNSSRETPIYPWCTHASVHEDANGVCLRCRREKKPYPTPHFDPPPHSLWY